MDAADDPFAAISFSELLWGSTDEDGHCVDPPRNACPSAPKVVTSEEDNDELHSALEDAESDEDERFPLDEKDGECGISTRGVPAEADVTLRENVSEADDSYYSQCRDRPESGRANDGQESPVEEKEDCEFSACAVLAEVTLLESDNDNDDSDSDRDRDDETEVKAKESDVELDDEGEEEFDDDGDESQEEDGNAVDDSASECETDDEGSVDSERSEDDYDRSVDNASCRSAPSLSDSGEDPQRHRLFLPRGVPASTESLKYEEDESSEEDDDGPPFLHKNTIGHGGRPGMWDGRPSSAPVSSGSDCSSDEGSRPSKKRKRACRRAGVSFNESVTVHSIFHSKAYPPSLVRRIYTKRDELRVNKIRSKKEFAYDSHDWRNATEEEDFETDGKGELVHPVHFMENSRRLASLRSAVQMSTRGSTQVGSAGSGAKRMPIHRLLR